MRDQSGLSTSESLLGRLKIRPLDSSAWGEFTGCYESLIRRWCRGNGLGEADVQDVSQNVLTRLITALRSFQYDPARGFRRWLRTVCRHARYDFVRAWRQPAVGTGDSRMLEILANHPASERHRRASDEEYDIELFERAMANVRSRVASHNWRAFVLSVLEGQSVDQTAKTLGLHSGMVYVARSKITKMLSQEIRRMQSSTEAASASAS